MPLDNPAAGVERDVVERVGELAEPTADRRHQAALLQHAALYEAAPAGRPPKLAPEAEHRAGRDQRSVQRRRGAAKIGETAHLQRFAGG